MFGFPKIFHLPYLPTPFGNNNMHLSLEELSIGSQEPLPVSEEGGAVEPEEVEGLERTTKSLEERQKVRIDAQKTEIIRLKGWKERYTRKYRGVKERVAELEHEIGKASEAHRETLEKRDQSTRAMADRLALKEELLATRSAELAVAQSFLSTADSLSEADVLDIVRCLNENVFQVAANLTEEWEKLGSSRADRFAIDQRDIEHFSRVYGPALVQQALNRDTTAVTFLVQSCLCTLATDIVSSWRHDRELAELEPVYQRLSASGKYTSRATGRRQLTYPRGTSNLGQMEVLDLQSPLSTTTSIRFDRGARRGCSLDHRVVLVHSPFGQFCKRGGGQGDRGHRTTRTPFEVHVHGGGHIQRHVPSIRNPAHGV